MLEGKEARKGASKRGCHLQMAEEEEDRRVMQQQQLSTPPNHMHCLNLHDDGNPRQLLGKAGGAREGLKESVVVAARAWWWCEECDGVHPSHRPAASKWLCHEWTFECLPDE